MCHFFNFYFCRWVFFMKDQNPSHPLNYLLPPCTILSHFRRTPLPLTIGRDLWTIPLWCKQIYFQPIQHIQSKFLCLFWKPRESTTTSLPITSRHYRSKFLKNETQSFKFITPLTVLMIGWSASETEWKF